MRTAARSALLWVLLLALAGCPSPPEKESRYPALPEGCPVEVYNDVPPTQTDNIGPVSATCDERFSNDECMRTLKDQACKLGANVVWGVTDDPKPENGKKRLFGRAAHTKAGAAK